MTTRKNDMFAFKFVVRVLWGRLKYGVKEHRLEFFLAGLATFSILYFADLCGFYLTVALAMLVLSLEILRMRRMVDRVALLSSRKSTVMTISHNIRDLYDRDPRFDDNIRNFVEAAAYYDAINLDDVRFAKFQCALDAFRRWCLCLFASLFYLVATIMIILFIEVFS